MAHLLLVEDERQNYDMMLRRLEGRGYEVTLATDGEEAVEKATTLEPDLVLMDIKLPKMDGLEATRMIRSRHKVKHIPIIALTAHAFTEDKDKATAAGCDDYHAKPVAFMQLIEQIEELLEDRVSDHRQKE